MISFDGNYFKQMVFMGFCLGLSSANLICEGVCNGMIYDKLPEQQWTWSYKKVFSDSECLKNSRINEIVFFKENVRNFSQLIFSWNSSKPKKGGFTFYAQTRDARSKKWSGWHKMFDWWSNSQRSYFSSNESSKYVHVRLETGLNSLADSFKIIIKSYGGADLGAVKSVCACTSNFNKFKYEIIDSKLFNLKYVYIKDVPKISQRLLDHSQNSRICSPTSCSMLAGYFNKFFANTNFIDPIEFTNNVLDPGLGDSGSYGNWSFNTAELYRKCNGGVFFYVQRMNGFVDLHEKLLAGCPVVVSIRGKLDGAQKAYKDGHLIVVVGFDPKDRSVICHDPAFYTDKSTLVKYKLGTFLRGWEGSNKLVYVANFKK